MTRRSIDVATAGGPAATLARFQQAHIRSSGPRAFDQLGRAADPAP